MKESQSETLTMPEEIEEVTVQALLTYIYTDKIDDDPTVAIDLLSLAK